MQALALPHRHPRDRARDICAVCILRIYNSSPPTNKSRSEVDIMADYAFVHVLALAAIAALLADHHMPQEDKSTAWYLALVCLCPFLALEVALWSFALYMCVARSVRIVRAKAERSRHCAPLPRVGEVSGLTAQFRLELCGVCRLPAWSSALSSLFTTNFTPSTAQVSVSITHMFFFSSWIPIMERDHSPKRIRETRHNACFV